MSIDFIKLMKEVPAETKEYINNAIDIFAAIDERKPECVIYDGPGKTIKTVETLSVNDKLYGSSFLSGFTFDGNVRRAMNLYCITYEQVLAYFGLKQTDIKKLNDEERSYYYEKYFKTWFQLIKDFYFGDRNKEVKNSEFTPELVVSYLVPTNVCYNKRRDENKKECGISLIVDSIYKQNNWHEEHAAWHNSFILVNHYAHKRLYEADYEKNINEPIASLPHYVDKSTDMGKVLCFKPRSTNKK